MTEAGDGMPQEETDLIAACADLIGRTGASGLQVRFCDEPLPLVWTTVATYPDGRFDAAGSNNVGEAHWRLVSQLLNGGTCTHCGRNVEVRRGSRPTPDDGLSTWGTCVYTYVPADITIKRGCQ